VQCADSPHPQTLHCSGQLHAIATNLNLDEGKRHGRTATGNLITREIKRDINDTQDYPSTGESSNMKPRLSRARNGAGLGEALSGGSAADSSHGFKSNTDGQLAFQETKRRLAKQASTIKLLLTRLV
jgi:hypothetical protein